MVLIMKLQNLTFWEACDVGLRDFPPGSSDLMGKLLGETPIKVLTQLPHSIKNYHSIVS